MRRHTAPPRAARPVLDLFRRLAGGLAALAIGALAAGGAGATPPDTPPGDGTMRGKPPIQSLSALAFAPDGTLVIGDGKGAALYAVDLGARTPPASDAPLLRVMDVETKLAARLGTTAGQVMIHDLAVDPISQAAYVAVSRGRGDWRSAWMLPNDLADAQVLMRIARDATVDVVPLDDVPYRRAMLRNPVSFDKTHSWKEGIALRADTITDLAIDGDTLYVAGLSNEEFSSSLWRIPFPFTAGDSLTTLEIFHAAHGEWETHAPIRALQPYSLGGERHLLAAYLCTPFVVFPVDKLADGSHVKGRTIAELGSGNYPIDMVAYRKGDEDRILIANSNLPLMILKARDIESFEGELIEQPEGYLAGVAYEPRSGTGVQQMDRLNDQALVVLQRLPGGTLDLLPMPIERL